MDPFVLNTLTRHVGRHFTRTKKAGADTSFIYDFSTVPGRQFRNEHGVRAKRLAVTTTGRYQEMYVVNLILHDPTRLIEDHDNGHPVWILHEHVPLFHEGLKKVLTRFQKIGSCEGCSCLIACDENYCLNCLLISSQGRKEETCAICSEDTDMYATLPCGHHYHVQCLASLVAKNSHGDCDCDEHCEKCPQCRREFTYPLGDVDN